MSQTISQVLIRYQSVIRILYHYAKEGTEMGKPMLSKSYGKSVFWSLIGHGAIQRSIEQCFDGNNRTQKAA